MDNETLRKVQLVQLEILKEVKRVCDENGICYWLTYGTILGAVRHKGFIPWDDDLDIGMLRTDYEKFLAIAGKSLGPKFFLQTWENDPYYPLPFAKVRKRDTKYVEFQFRNSRALGGIYIDIFPYDKYGNSLLQGIKLKMIKLAMFAKCGFSRWVDPDGINLKRFILHLPARVLARLIPRASLIKVYDKCAVKYNARDCEYYFCQGFDRYKTTSLIPIGILEEFTQIPFEDDVFSVPAQYIEFLKRNYSNYQTLPPEEARENRHEIIEVKF